MTGAVEARRAIEALRAGVPNEAAVAALDTAETGIGSRFRAALDRASVYGNLATTPGLLVAGGFGAGKSHLLGCLRLQALAQNFVVSQVSISKETPLYDLGKVYAAAMRNTTVPQTNDDAMRALLEKLRSDDELFEQLTRWINATPRPVAPIFAGLLHLLPKSSTGAELKRRFERFLAGGKINKGVLGQALRDSGARGQFDLKFSDTAIAADRVRLAPRLMRAAGYRGWCVLFDEVELIGRYSPLQRGKAYAELGRWLGLDDATSVEGLVTVAAITDDFESGVIVAKRDNQTMESRLAAKGLVAEARRAAAAMVAIHAAALSLHTPKAADLALDLEKLRQIYASAYHPFVPPAIEIGTIASTKPMRSFIRSWITQWDMLRLYGETAAIETTNLETLYTDMAELEQQSPDSEPEDE
jgi:hypothetical protein